MAGSNYYFGAIIHFDGASWKFVDIAKKRVGFSQIKKEEGGNNYYLAGTRFESTGDTNKIFRYDGKKLSEIYSGTAVATVNEINGKIYITSQGKIYKVSGNKLEVWKDFTNTTYGGRVWGRSEKDFFGVAYDGLAHYNGTDVQTIYPTNMFINDVFVMEKDVYVLCENRIIIHGKLNSE